MPGILKDNELARRDDGAVECRRDPLRLAWTVANLATSDAHALSCTFSCSVRIADNPADRKMFAEVFLAARDVISADVISSHFAAAIRSTCAEISSRRSAADLVGKFASLRQEWIAAIQKALSPVAFSCGLEILPPFQLDVESHTLQRQQIEEIARARTEALTAGQMQHLQRASELLKQFQVLRESAPQLSAGQLLEQFGASDRGLTLQTLLLASAQESKATATSLWAVSGAALVQIDPRTTPPRLKLIQPLTDLGPLRSVQAATARGQQWLLIGARSGVIGVSLENPASDHRLYAMPGLDSQLGFNAVVCDANHLWASHGDAGIVAWSWDDPNAPSAIYAEKLTPLPEAAPALRDPINRSS